MNPFYPRYTLHQAQLIRSQRAALIARWTRLVEAPMTIAFDSELVTETGDVLDVVRVSNAPPVFSPTWVAETRAFVVEHRPRGFDVLVPHSTYLRAQRCCISVDRSCALASTTTLVLALVLLRASFALVYLS